jgi:hypothetical protein
MRASFLLILVVVLSSILTSCGPMPEDIQLAVLQTQSKWTAVPTQTDYPTYTPFPTYTPYPTYTLFPTPRYTATPKPPTNTPVPTIPPTPEFAAQTQQLGPVYDSIYDSQYSMEISVNDVDWIKSESYNEPKTGNMYVTVYIKAKNLGPGPVRSFGYGSFQVLDGNGIIHDEDFLSSSENCRLDIVDMIPNAVLEGCVSFEVPKTGKVDFIYAPFQYEGLQPGRYLAFTIRE